MKRLLSCLIPIILLFSACSQSPTRIDSVSHEIMGGAITVPEGTSAFASAVFEAADEAVNQVATKTAKKKPEFISFNFSGDVLLSNAEKELLINAFSVYGIEITQGRRTDLADQDRGFTVGFDSIQNHQVSDCDLTVPVQVYYGRYVYTYCADFKLSKGKYVLFRFELLERNRHVF